ncbi:MAG: hypothetical protein GX657_09370 [Chloroflexi bacterium]|jgi:hypothetical protein|nr:hypothetical protein [Chloroflexota bacterium]
MFAAPLFIMGSTVATIWAALFHLVYGRRFSDLILYWFVALVGFFVGQALADIAGLRWLLLGQVHIVEGTVACGAAMALARWLKSG